MGGQRCCVCGNRQARDPAASFHRFPRDTVRNSMARGVWSRSPVLEFVPGTFQKGI